MKNKTEEHYTIAYIAVFGTLWGISEAVLGGFLHIINMPFKGTVLTAIGTVILLTGAWLLPVKRGFPFLYMGCIACVVKLFSMGVLRINIFVSLMIEAFLLQITVSALGYNILGYLAAGMLACLWPLFSRMLLYGLIFGQGFYNMYYDTLKEAQKIVGLSFKGGIIILGIMTAIHAAAGLAAGYIGWMSGRKLKGIKYGKI